MSVSYRDIEIEVPHIKENPFSNDNLLGISTALGIYSIEFSERGQSGVLKLFFPCVCISLLHGI